MFLYHLHLLQKLKKANDTGELYSYHFVLLRQVLENVASFLGVGNFGYVLDKIGVNKEQNANIVNVLSHKNLFYYETDLMGEDSKKIFKEILIGLFEKYEFKV